MTVKLEILNNIDVATMDPERPNNKPLPKKKETSRYGASPSSFFSTSNP